MIKIFIKSELDKRKIISIDNVFLFYSFYYQIAFGHFIEQCIPKINYFLNLKKKIADLKLCIPRKRLNLITKDIIHLLKINDIDLLIIEEDIIYLINNFYYFNYDCADFNVDKINSFNLIRENLLIKTNTSYKRNVYLKYYTS